MGDLEPRVDIPARLAKILVPAAAAALFGSHPGLAVFLAAAIDQVIPDRRAKWIARLFERVGELNAARGYSALPLAQDDERVWLLEDSIFSAARGTSSDRVDYIANILANGLTASDARVIDRRYLLRLLDEMNDLEVLLLCLYGRESDARAQEFWEQHKPSLDCEPACLGSPQPVFDREAIRHSYENHLARLGLLDDRLWFGVRPGEVPEFDTRGRPQGMRLELSPLGRLVLREIGQPSDLDLPSDSQQ